MPKKPIKRGIKLWSRGDSHNGYMCELQVYTGKSESVEEGLGKRVVLDLVRQLEGKKYLPPLLQQLLFCLPPHHSAGEGLLWLWHWEAELQRLP